MAYEKQNRSIFIGFESNVTADEYIGLFEFENTLNDLNLLGRKNNWALPVSLLMCYAWVYVFSASSATHLSVPVADDAFHAASRLLRDSYFMSYSRASFCEVPFV
jgi:hypothetical protein